MKERMGGVLPSKVGIISAANLILIYLCDEVVISDILFERGAKFIDQIVRWWAYLRNFALKFCY